MAVILIDKEQTKHKMVEFIINQYWMDDKPPQFKDIKEKFYQLSDGTTSNYLDELITEKKIQKWRNENKTYYGPPKIHPAVKFCVIVTMICMIATFLLLILYPTVLAFSFLFFDAGVIFTCFFWRFSMEKNRRFK